MYSELIDALRICSDSTIETCDGCKYWTYDREVDRCRMNAMRDAADALEAADKRIAELEDDLLNLMPAVIAAERKDDGN